MILALLACGPEYQPNDDTQTEGVSDSGNEVELEDTGDSGDSGTDDAGMAKVTVRTRVGLMAAPGMAVSAFALDPDGNEVYLASGWGGEEFAVPSGTVRFYIGNPTVDEWTEDDYLTTHYEGLAYVAAPTDVTLTPGDTSEPELAAHLLIGEKYYNGITADCWDLNDGRAHETEYSKGTDWETDWDLWDPWLYQRSATLLVPEADEGAELPFGFLQPGEWLEVEGDTIVLQPDGVTNLIRDVRASDDDFSFVYIDTVTDCWWEVEARAW